MNKAPNTPVEIVTFKISPKLKRKLRLISATSDMTMTEVIEKWIEDYKI